MIQAIRTGFLSEPTATMALRLPITLNWMTRLPIQEMSILSLHHLPHYHLGRPSVKSLRRRPPRLVLDLLLHWRVSCKRGAYGPLAYRLHSHPSYHAVPRRIPRMVKSKAHRFPTDRSLLKRLAEKRPVAYQGRNFPPLRRNVKPIRLPHQTLTWPLRHLADTICTMSTRWYL